MNIETREKIGRFKYVAEDDIQAQYDEIIAKLDAEIANFANREEA